MKKGETTQAEFVNRLGQVFTFKRLFNDECIQLVLGSQQLSTYPVGLEQGMRCLLRWDSLAGYTGWIYSGLLIPRHPKVVTKAPAAKRRDSRKGKQLTTKEIANLNPELERKVRDLRDDWSEFEHTAQIIAQMALLANADTTICFNDPASTRMARVAADCLKTAALAYMELIEIEAFYK